jgi:putative flippase GtrA
VSSARRLYERFRQLIHEGAKFGVIGIAGVFIYLWIANALHSIGPLKAATVAVIVTTLISYVANRYWSFRHRERTTVRRETVLFFALNGVGLLIQWILVGFTVYGLGQTGLLAYNIANMLGIVLGTLFRFWSYRKWVWAAGQKSAEDHESLEPAMAGPATGALAATPAHPTAVHPDGEGAGKPI